MYVMKKVNTQEMKIREPIVDGIFYSNDQTELHNRVNSLLNSAEVSDNNAIASIVPHAGYNYSGRYTAAAIRSASGRTIKQVTILAPVHRDPVDGIFLPESKYFRTPLGDIEVDQVAMDNIESNSTKIVINDIPHLEEHCIEVILPFIQVQFPEAKIVPILLGKASKTNIHILANAINTAYSEQTHESLLLVSSNLCAYDEYEKANKQSERFLELVLSGSWENILQAMEQRTVTACGAGCLASFYAMEQTGLKPTILLSGDSSEANNDSSHIVKYAAISFTQTKGAS